VPTSALKSPLVLPILGLLVEAPAHAYALTARLGERYPYLAPRRSSVTTLLRSLTEAGLVTPGAPERAGRRPQRSVHTLTEAGMDELRERVQRHIVEARSGSVELTTAIAYAGVMSPTVANATFRARIEQLEHQRDALAEHPPGLPELHMLETSYGRAVLLADISWLEEIRDRLSAGTLAWPDLTPTSEKQAGT
jgi:DNA-binding PadR family transcriptional regulator